jgi:predicted transcriptional regulator
MKVRIVKRRKPSDTEDMVKAWEKRYGTLQSLQQKVKITKCASPEMMVDYVIWKALSEGGEFQDVVVVKDAEIFGTLSPRRAELLEYIMGNDVDSIRTLAAALHRNYKNVYDDLLALAKFGLVDLVPHGRALRPCAPAFRIEIAIDA